MSSIPAIVYASDHSPSVLSAHQWRTVANSVPYILPLLSSSLPLLSSSSSSLALKILDVGCGPGSITIDLARHVQSQAGHVTGLEYTDEPLQQARAAASAQGITNIDFRVGDIHKLDFADGSFDLVHAHQVLQHVADPVQALREMRRVTRKGGHVCVRESASKLWFPASEGLEKWNRLVHTVGTAKGSNPDAGARIHAWAHEAGFAWEDIKCTAGSWCFQTPQERQWWAGSFIGRAAGGQFRKFAIEGGHATAEDLDEIVRAWEQWRDSEEGWFSILHGEITCHV
ncbi:S-adenosyl-L-methionine-dependent methyltransferase [Xylogone sp. PMI_703]|nr:S-adenosyl-L-methionine-dependent methyltransferase [Xylogone sp. PMI_703]